MKIGIAVRSMGLQSAADTFVACVRAAEDAGLDDIWVQDHIAIPPDDAEGSGGRYLDPLAALAYLAAATDRIGLGTGVLILPYRAPLPTAKAIATIQELSGGRLRLGVGAGWMAPEFRALGVARSQRGRITDETLDFLTRCFEADEVEANGQSFLFLPRPQRPPIYVGGGAPHALERAARFGDGWMPMGAQPEDLARHVGQLRELFDAAGRGSPAVVVMTGFDTTEAVRAADQMCALVDAGATALVLAARYADATEFQRNLEFITTHLRPALLDTAQDA